MPGDGTQEWEREYRASVARQMADLSKQQAELGKTLQATALLIERVSNRLDAQDGRIKETQERIEALEARPVKVREARVNLMSAQGQYASAWLAGCAIIIALLPLIQAHWR